VNRFLFSAGLAALALGAAGCRGEVSEDPPITLIRNMHKQPKYKEQSASSYFADGRTMRPALEGTLSQESYSADDEVATGRTADDLDYVREVPKKVFESFGGVDATLSRGKERFGVYCAPCHGLVGDGNGVVAQRGLNGVASLHQDRIRTGADGQLYATIANGVRRMPGYAAQIPVNDRWAVVAYVRALELSQVSAK
jgi:hypothetical protein